MAKEALHRPCSHTCGESGNCLAFAARDKSGHLEPYRFDRRPGGAGSSLWDQCWLGAVACMCSIGRLLAGSEAASRAVRCVCMPPQHLPTETLPPDLTPPGMHHWPRAVGPDDIRIQITHW